MRAPRLAATRSTSARDSTDLVRETDGAFARSRIVEYGSGAGQHLPWAAFTQGVKRGVDLNPGG
ncbi:hypothetical protein [Streptomyces dioscori]|uniref:hypothetical protein n=1 Tax=Streptomyces dioscori TaxID=2109333 RepID=UPI00131CFDD0|nr:hypothetical protein [Streptomyces dioscori]